jgi:3-methyl-2-oxobutanoate hydroxymethyltransferase
MEDMIHHIRPVVKGAPDTWVVGDMPFGSYNVSDEEAVRNETD